MTDIIELKPCPFCGNSASIERYGDRSQSTIYRCDFCSCSLETGEEWDHGKGWNRRHSPPVAAIYDAKGISQKSMTIVYEAELAGTPAPAADDWIPWNGGECPVDGGTRLDVRYDNGGELHGYTAYLYDWSRSLGPPFIAAYRPAKDVSP